MRRTGAAHTWAPIASRERKQGTVKALYKMRVHTLPVQLYFPPQWSSPISPVTYLTTSNVPRFSCHALGTAIFTERKNTPLNWPLKLHQHGDLNRLDRSRSDHTELGTPGHLDELVTGQVDGSHTDPRKKRGQPPDSLHSRVRRSRYGSRLADRLLCLPLVLLDPRAAGHTAPPATSPAQELGLCGVRRVGIRESHIGVAEYSVPLSSARAAGSFDSCSVCYRLCCCWGFLVTDFFFTQK